MTVKAILLWVLGIAYMLAIWVMSSRPVAVPLPSSLPNVDKLVHFVAFFVLALLLTHAAALTWPGQFRTWAWPGQFRIGGWATLFLAVCLWGAIDEIHQSYTPARTPSFWDWLADCAGALMGVSLYAILRAKHYLCRGNGSTSTRSDT